MADKIVLDVCRAKYKHHSRNPHLIEMWAYKYGGRLLDELEQARKRITELEEAKNSEPIYKELCSFSDDGKHIYFVRHSDGKLECDYCGFIKEQS